MPPQTYDNLSALSAIAPGTVVCRPCEGREPTSASDAVADETVAMRKSAWYECLP